MVRRQKVSKGKARDEGREREAMRIRDHFEWERHSHCCIAAGMHGDGVSIVTV